MSDPDLIIVFQDPDPSVVLVTPPVIIDGGGGGGGGAVDSVNGHTGVVVLVKADVGLGNVDNTTDAAKPVSTATATAITSASTADRARSNHTGTQAATTITGLATVATTGAKGDVGLGNVDNTSDVNKPVSTATTAAITAASTTDRDRANHTGTQAVGTITGLAAVATSGAKGDVGLGNVDNTSDANKPVSTAAATALAGKANTSHTHAESDVTGLVTDLAGKAATVHTHAAADVTSGTLAVARIGSGTAAAGKYVDGGTGAWTTLPTGGGGGSTPTIRLKTSAYTAVTGDVVLCDATSAAFTITLGTPTAGETVTVKKVDSSAHAVLVDATALIEGEAGGVSLDDQWSGASFIGDGTNWVLTALVYHGAPGVVLVPSDAYPLAQYGAFAMSCDPMLCSNSGSFTGVGMIRLPVPAGWRIEGARFFLSSSGSGGTGRNGWAVYEDDTTKAAETTGSGWSGTGWVSKAFTASVAAQAVDRMVNLAFDADGVSGAAGLYHSGIGSGHEIALNHGGGGRRSLYSLASGSTWPSTWDFTTGGLESSWLPLYGLYGTKVL